MDKDYVNLRDVKPRNNPYTEEDKELLAKMKKIPKEATEFNEKITFTFCSREMWGAQDPNPELPMRTVNFPVSSVRFVDTGTDECYTPRECFRLLQHLQLDHMQKENLPDIKYNFMVAGDGTIYEGRGWRNDADRPPHMAYLERDCIDIGFIGNINDEAQDDDRDPFPRMKCECRGHDWALYGQDNNYIKKDFDIISSFSDDAPGEDETNTHKITAKKAAMDWVVHGQEGNNYVSPGFFLVQF